MGEFRSVTNGRERWHGGARAPRHRHDRAYAAIVLSGGYEEAGSRGRFFLQPGDVLVHDAFEAHLNRFEKGGAEILNIGLARRAICGGKGLVADPDLIARKAEEDALEAEEALLVQFVPAGAEPGDDWPDALARRLALNPDCRLADWAAENALAPETLSRGFGRRYGVTPLAFRAEARARLAFAAITGAEVGLSDIAAATGFADQAHMTRAVTALTGASPAAWRRRSNFFKTANGRLR
ncbi:MAG TPA: helix-turn-helix domain-containing protein [Parvularculaceae bacterium]|nr:helix-turn-helix domain-containing protein [Parvularculaceae bacterium]